MCRNSSKYPWKPDEVPVHLGDLHATSLTHLAFFSHPGFQLGHGNIAKSSELTTLKYLELEGWDDWEALAPLRSLSLLEILSCKSSLMLFGILSSGAWDNLEAIILAESIIMCENHSNHQSVQRWLQEKGIDTETALTRLADRVVQLPQLLSIQYRLTWHPEDELELQQGISDTVMHIAGLHADQWWQLVGQPGLLMYQRKGGEVLS